ncbi:MAG: Flp/Fap pilin component [Acidimicrobiaceae bacterium]|jgi:pilus assembly protein Flp/PilA
MKSPKRTLHRPEERDKRDRGASLVEYALLLALLVVVCIGALTFFGSQLNTSYSKSGNSIVNAN